MKYKVNINMDMFGNRKYSKLSKIAFTLSVINSVVLAVIILYIMMKK